MYASDSRSPNFLLKMSAAEIPAFCGRDSRFLRLTAFCQTCFDCLDEEAAEIRNCRFCFFEQVLGSGWEVEVESCCHVPPFLIRKSFLTSRMSAALVFLFAGYCFQASQTGFSRSGMENVTWFVMFLPQ